MKVHEFGDKSNPVILLLPGTMCYWKGNFGHVIDNLKEDFLVAAVAYTGFDETDTESYSSVTQELEKILVKDVTREITCLVTPLDPESFAEIPEELRSGKTVKESEFTTKAVVAFVRITFASMGIDPDQYDLESLAGAAGL